MRHPNARGSVLFGELLALVIVLILFWAVYDTAARLFGR